MERKDNDWKCDLDTVSHKYCHIEEKNPFDECMRARTHTHSLLQKDAPQGIWLQTEQQFVGVLI